MFMYFDPMWFIIVGPGMLLAMWAQIKVKTAFAKYSRIGSSSGVSGADAARRILQRNGIHDVDVEMSEGFLSDHYDPRSKTLRLSPKVYQGSSLSSVGVAAHEAGHALQHAKDYAPLSLRSVLAVPTMIGTNMAQILLVIGFMIMWLVPTLGRLGAIVMIGAVIGFFLAFLFQLVTLPVEFNASKRAIAALTDANVIAQDEIMGAKKVLSAAALTYVAAAIVALLQLLYILFWLWRSGIIGGGDD